MIPLFITKVTFYSRTQNKVSKLLQLWQCLIHFFEDGPGWVGETLHLFVLIYLTSSFQITYNTTPKGEVSSHIDPF